MITAYFQTLRLGLPFSDKQIIPWNTEQDGTDGSVPSEFSLFCGREKTSEFLSEPFLGREKPSEFRSEPFLGREKPSEFHSEPFLGREKPSEFRSEPFLDKKNLGILYWTIFGREKTLEFRSKSFSEEKKLRKKMTFVSCFIKLHYFVEFCFVPFCSELQNGLFWNTRNPTEWALYSVE